MEHYDATNKFITDSKHLQGRPKNRGHFVLRPMT